MGAVSCYEGRRQLWKEGVAVRQDKTACVLVAHRHSERPLISTRGDKQNTVDAIETADADDAAASSPQILTHSVDGTLGLVVLQLVRQNYKT